MEKLDLFNENCMDINLPKCRLLLTDIPYEAVNRNDNGLRNLNKDKADIKTFELDKFLNHIYESADIFIIFCGNEQYSKIYDFFNNKEGTVRQIIWAKSNPSPMNGEYIYLNGTENAVWFKKKSTGKLNCKCKKNWFIHSTGSSKIHPTEKNHNLLRELIRDNSNENDLVIDTCMGSGSTGLIAKELNRQFLGIEIDKNYFEIARKRIREQKTLLSDN